MLSPAVLTAAAAEGASVVMTLHNYRLLCLPSTFMRDGRVCEDCLDRLPWPGIVHRCYRDSLLASSAVAGSLTLHRALGTLDHVRLYLAVSNFVREKYLLAGFPSARVAVKPNFVHPLSRRQGAGDYFLFLGRLSREKGVSTLIDVARQSPLPIVVAGDGPERSLLLDAPTSVDYRGNLRPDELPPLLGRARALLLPSISYEGAPRVVLEAYAAGVPVVASRIGALPELVEDGESGLLVTPNDVSEWRAALERLTDDAESERLGARAWHLWKQHYSPERGLANLEAAYRGSTQPLATTP
jgi:glycosyltransferase involved in cell wall biosynthesis